MRRDEALKVMTLGLRVGEVMLESSVAVSDVEEAIRRITDPMGLERCEVSVTLDVITLNYLHPSLEMPITLIRVVRIGEPRLDRLIALEEFSRRVESGELDLAGASREIERFDQVDSRYPRYVTVAGAVVSVAAWVLFAGGGFVGASAAAIAGGINELFVNPLSRTRVPVVFTTFLAAVVVAAVPNLFAWAELPISVVPAIVGGIYPLLPGGALVASVTDGLSGAPLSSLAKGLEATIIATAVALGTASTLTLAAEMGIESGIERPPTSTLSTLLYAAIAVSGLAAARSMPLRFIPTTAAVAMTAWWVHRFVTQAGLNPILGIFLAAAVLGLGGKLMARVQHTTATVHTASAIYVLVPGFSFYLAMAAFAGENAQAGFPVMIDALGRAGAIAAGVALGVALGRSVPAPRPRVQLWRRSNRRRTSGFDTGPGHTS